MKSQIHENKKNKLQSLSKKVLMLAALVLGTTTMVNAKTTPVKNATAKEVSISKHKKNKAVRKAKKLEAKKVETSKK